MQGLLDKLLAQAERTPDARAFVELNRRGEEIAELSRRSLYQRANRVAVRLREIGRDGANVMILLPHGMQFVLCFYGCLLAGRVALPYKIPKSADVPRLLSVLQTAQVAAIVTVKQQEAKVREWLAGAALRIPLLLFDDLAADVSESGVPFHTSRASADERAVLQFTSGTTSSPKGVVISHGALAHNSTAITRAFGLRSGERMVSWLPFTHDMGLIGHVVLPVYSALTSVFMSPVAFVSNPAIWLQAISHYRAQCSGAPNFAYRLCCDKIAESLFEVDLSCWEVAYCGSERIEPRTAATFIKKFARYGLPARSFYPCYGLAESTLFVTGRHGVKTTLSKTTGALCVSVGAPADESFQLAIKDDRQARCADGDVGEIWIKSPSNACGFYGESGYSSRPFTADAKYTPEFIPTGDIGYLEAGELYVVGRIKDVIKIRGLAFAAEDLELAIGDAANSLGITIYAVAAIAVVEDEHERIVGLLECDVDGQSVDGQGIDKRDVGVAHVRQQIRRRVCDATGAVLDDLVLLSRHALPRTTSGKVKRGQCAAIFLEEKSRWNPSQQLGVAHDAAHIDAATVEAD